MQVVDVGHAIGPPTFGDDRAVERVEGVRIARGLVLDVERADVDRRDAVARVSLRCVV